jgi:hypothetical protein
MNELKKEITELRLMDLFEYKKLDESPAASQINETNEEYSFFNALSDGGGEWLCYLCANPHKANELLDASKSSKPLIQVKFKEKHGKWKFLKRWQDRMFTLTGDSIVYFKEDMVKSKLYLFFPFLRINHLNSVMFFENWIQNMARDLKSYTQIN